MVQVGRTALLVVAMLGLITLPANWPGLVGVAHAGHFPWDQGHDTFMPEFGDLETDPGDDDCNNSGSPFEVATGNFLHTSTDLFIPTLGPDFDITRTYNSRDRRSGLFGHGWTLTYDQRLIEATDGVSLLVICRQGNGKRERFVRNADGTYTAPPDLSTVLIKHADGTLTLTEQDGAQRRFDAHGRLMTWVDRHGNTMTMRYDDTGFLLSLSDANGRMVAFTKGANGKIASVTDPAGRVFRYDYDANGNLVGSTDPLGSTTRYVYDADHKLVRVIDPLGRVMQQASYDERGRVKTFTEQGETWTVSYFPDQKKTTKQDARGHTWTYFYNDNGNITRLVDPIGKRLDFAYNTNFYLSSITDNRGNATTLTYDAHGNVTAITSTVNGHVFTSTFDPVAKTLTNRTPVGRQSITTFDDKHRVTQLAFSGLLPIQYTYNDQGRVSKIAQGERTYTFAYDDQGYLASLTDPLGHSIRFAYDAAGRVTRQTLADGREIQYSYDTNGNLTTLIPPGRPPHRFTYNALGQEVEHTAPAVGSEVTRSLYRYGSNHELVQRQRPDGTMLNFGYNAAGQLTNVQLSRGDITLAYNPQTGQLQAITEPNGSEVAYTYEDSRLTKTTWAGPITGSVERTYDRHFNLTSRSVNEAHVVTFQYDPDSLLTAVGPLALYLDSQNALLTGTSLGNVTDAHKYNDYGEEIEYRAAYQNKALLTLQYTRDAIGRIAKQTETIAGQTHTYTYHYNASRQLTAVEKDGHLLARYEYDANGNRLKHTGPAGRVTGNYDAQDRLLQYDNTRYTYTAAGDLQAKSTAGRRWLIFSRQRTTAYDYDALGNLRSVNLPDGTQIEYLIDGDNRRIGKKVNGSLMQGFLYKNGLNPIAELDGTGTVVARFVYGTRSHVPDYLIKHGVTYRVLVDYRGSPRLVVNVENGEIVQRLDYDEFGSILIDTNPGFQPFGFAGGLYDTHTGLLRFGARDYDPTTGRWTTQDPIRFGGRNPNLYVYAYNDPVNYIDPSGLFSDVVDFYFFGRSLYDFIKCPSLGTAVGLALDTLGLLPLVPALGTLQRIDDIYDELRWADDAFDARRGFSTNGYTPGLCFAAGTEIATAEGEKAIEDIEVGDLVRAYDEQTGETKLRQVVGTFSRIATLLVVLSAGGETIETTPEHPFWVIDRGSVEAYNLAVGDCLWTLHGDHLAIDRIEYREVSFPVYNFEVEGLHTYFVSQKHVLVHNSCTAKEAPRWPETPSEMDDFLGIPGEHIPDGPLYPGRDKVVWKPSQGVKITYKQHPYHPSAPWLHTEPHWHLDTSWLEHELHIPGERIPGY